MKSKSKYEHFHSWKHIWKCRLQNGSYFVSILLCKNRRLDSSVETPAKYQSDWGQSLRKNHGLENWSGKGGGRLKSMSGPKKCLNFTLSLFSSTLKKGGVKNLYFLPVPWKRGAILRNLLISLTSWVTPPPPPPPPPPPLQCRLQNGGHFASALMCKNRRLDSSVETPAKYQSDWGQSLRKNHGL